MLPLRGGKGWGVSRLNYETFSAVRSPSGVVVQMRVEATETGTVIATFEIESPAGLIRPTHEYAGVRTSRVPLAFFHLGAPTDATIRLDAILGIGPHKIHILIGGKREAATDIVDRL
jgi:hypothetical protein